MKNAVFVFLCLTFSIICVGACDRAGNAEAGILGDFSVKEEIELGEKFRVLIHSRFPLVEDPEITGYIEEMVDGLVRAMPPQPFPITPAVINNNAMNAFASPGGYIYVFTGMILNVEDESELAGVLAHELAHISQRHIAKHIERSNLINIGSMLGVLAGALIGPKEAGSAIMYGALAGGQSAYLSYSREDEREADQVGVNYLVEAGYRPQGLPESFEKIRRKKWLSGGNLPAYLSTHPDVEERIDYLEQRLKRYPDGVRSRSSQNERLRRIQTILRARYTDANEALLYFSQKQHNDECLPILGRAICLDRLNRVNEANAAFEQALSCGKDDSLVLREAGRSFFLQGAFDRAEELLQEAVLRNPKDLMALFYYARLLSETQRTAQAVQYMQRVMRKLPEDPEIHYYMGRILGKEGESFQAHLHLTYWALYGNDPKMSDFHLNKVRHLARTQEEKQSLEKLERTYKERAEFWDN